MLAVEWFVKRLCEHGVEWMATLCGHGLDPLYKAAREAGIRLVDTRNEQTASYIADRYGRLTRLPGVCAVSSGVAHVNALGGVANAWFDHAPMLLISGAGPLGTHGMGHFQDMDQLSLAAPLTRYARTVDSPERVIQILDTAWARALGPEPGPVHLTFPLDIQTAEVAEADLVRIPIATPRIAAPEDEPDAIARALRESQRPVIVAGSLAYYAGLGGALMEFAAKAAIPVVIPIWDPGLVDEPSPVFLGVVGAATGEPRIVADADLVILAGAQPDYRVGYLQGSVEAPGPSVFYCLSGWPELARLWAGPLPQHQHWLEEARRRRAQFTQAVERSGEAQAQGKTHAIHIVRALQQLLPADACLVIDGGAIGQWVHQLLCHDRYPSFWLTPGPSGAVGYGVGGAIAARLVFPDRPVVLLSGDGAFTFNATDLERAVQQQLWFVAIVADDQGWGLTREGHKREFGEEIATSLGPVDFAALAASLGAWARRIEQPQELAPALQHALDLQQVAVLHVPVTGGIPEPGEQP